VPEAIHPHFYNEACPNMNLNNQNIRWDGFFPPAPRHDASAFAPLHAGKSVLVTGAGGSIGSALAKTIHGMAPRCLVLLDSSEQNLFRMHSGLSQQSGPQRHVPLLGSVADERCLLDLFERYRPQIVYHAAAFKHVPLMEMNPFAVLQNNVFGTSTLAMVAQRFDAARLIMISTDKAVNSQSIMGATKRLAELVLLGMPAARTRMASVRLGNVLASEGSVVPLFSDQIARGGPVTVTHPEVERYFLTMEETVHRVLSAAASCPAEGAIAVPVMGEPVRIAALAEYLIRQSAAKNIAIAYTGLRPGDKLREDFVSARESAMAAPVDGIFWVHSPRLPDAELAAGLAALTVALNDRNLAQLLATLTRLVPEYEPSDYLRRQTTTAAAT